MPILLRTQIERTAKAPIPACHARVGGLCGFQDTVERVPAGSPKTGRCAAVRERWQKTSEQDEMTAGKAACGFSLCRNPLAGILFLLLPFLHRSRTSAQRLVLSPLVGTRSAGLRKSHKLPTLA